LQHAIIIAHPKPSSFTHSIAKAYVEAIVARGHHVVERDLYAMNFDPCLKAEETPGPTGYHTSPDAAAERLRLANVDVFAFFYPWWFNAPPAILKGYVDRIFSTGFGYRPTFGGTGPALEGKRLISFSSSGAPDYWVRETDALEVLIRGFDHHLCGVCGLEFMDHVHFGGVIPGMTEEQASDLLAKVETTAQWHLDPGKTG
jgi:NAD(P)H dehydrogenase (quinone)